MDMLVTEHVCVISAMILKVFRRLLILCWKQLVNLFLGYDRRLPGFPRYTVLGSDGNGEFSLQIVNATLTDDAVYECQVGPAPNNKPIRASAQLSVLRKAIIFTFTCT